MVLRMLKGIRDNLDSILDWTEILGSFGVVIIILFFNFFGIHDITVEIAVLLFFLGLLAVSRRLDRQINQATRQSTQEAVQAIQTLSVQLTTSQRVLEALEARMRELGANQSALEHSLQALSNSVKSLTRNKFYPDQDEAFKSLLEYINTNPVKEATFLQYSCKQSESLLYPLVLNKKARATVYIQHEEVPAQLKSERQVDRITSTIRNSLSDLSRKLSDPSNLQVYKFKTPASVRAIQLDDQVLCVGWYTYERVNRKGWSTFPDDQTAISGDDRPTIVAWKGTEAYDVLNQMVTVMVENYQEYAERVPL
jgi:hypothetical protein